LRKNIKLGIDPFWKESPFLNSHEKGRRKEVIKEYNLHQKKKIIKHSRNPVQIIDEKELNLLYEFSLERTYYRRACLKINFIIQK